MDSKTGAKSVRINQNSTFPVRVDSKFTIHSVQCDNVRPPGFSFHSICAYSSPMGERATHRIYMSFFQRNGWYCQFLEPDLKTPLPRTFRFATADKVRALVERGGGFRVLADRQAFDYALGIGRGGVYLTLTAEQYGKLKRS